jgi:hypothetical protein
MPHIVLNPEQARVLNEAAQPVEIRDEQGRVLTRIPPLSEAAVVAEAQRRAQAGGPRYPAAEVERRLARLEEISRKENLDAGRAADLIRKMRAGDEE